MRHRKNRHFFLHLRPLHALRRDLETAHPHLHPERWTVQLVALPVPAVQHPHVYPAYISLDPPVSAEADPAHLSHVLRPSGRHHRVRRHHRPSLSAARADRFLLRLAHFTDRTGHIRGNRLSPSSERPSKKGAAAPFSVCHLSYLACCLAAVFLNTIYDRYGTINLFYINPDYRMQQIIFRDLVPRLGNTAVILLYIACTILGAFLIFLLWNATFRLRRRS